MKEKTQTIQSIPDMLFFDFSPFFYGEPFIKNVTGSLGNTLLQPIKIDGQYLHIALNREMYISSCMLIGGSVSEKQIERKKIVFIVYAGKIHGLVGKQRFKNRIYHDSKGKIDFDQQEAYLHVTATAMSRLDMINRNRPKAYKKRGSSNRFF
jgi:hypothetical protein